MRSVPRRTGGFSLIELMIAVTLGLVVTAAIGYIFVSSKRNLNYTQGMSRVQENARSSLVLVNTMIRQAGYIYDPFSDTDPTAVFVSPAYAIYGGIANGSGATLSSTFVGANSTYSGAGDFIQVSFVGDGSTGTLRNCLGGTVGTNEISMNIFYVDQKNNEAAPSLYCTTETVSKASPTTVDSGPTTAPLVFGVTSLSLSYGVDSDATPDRIPNYYSTAAQVTTASAWQKVVSVVMTMTTQSTSSVDITGNVTSNGTTTMSGSSATGYYLQRPLTQTIQIRNRIQ